MGCFINEKSSVRRTQLCKYKTIILIEADYKKYLSLTRIMKFFFFIHFHTQQYLLKWCEFPLLLQNRFIEKSLLNQFLWCLWFRSHEHDNIVNFVSIWHIHWSLMWSSIKNELKWKELVFHWSGFLAVLMICTIFFSL